MDEPARICARLLSAGAVPRAELPGLDHPSIRMEVEERLSRCGLALASSAYSDHYGLRLSTDIADASVIDAPSNLGLGADACALIAILWMRLALQRRTAEDTRTTPDDQPALLPEQKREAARSYVPSVRFETLVREFGPHLGGRTRLKALLGHLRRLAFVNYHRLDRIEAGPLLELGVDGEQMVSFIRSRVLSQYLEESPAPEEPELHEANAGDQVLSIVASDPRPLGIGDIAHKTGLPRRQIRKVLDELRQDGKIEMLGARGQARYRAMPTKDL